jgi:hypothetical protein
MILVDSWFCEMCLSRAGQKRDRKTLMRTEGYSVLKDLVPLVAVAARVSKPFLYYDFSHISCSIS